MVNEVLDRAREKYNKLSDKEKIRVNKRVEILTDALKNHLNMK